MLGVVLGGTLATHFGWRQAFIAVGAPGLILAAICPFVVRDDRAAALTRPKGGPGTGVAPTTLLDLARAVVGTRAAIFVYLASGVQMFMPGVLVAWMPSYLNRYYAMTPERAATFAGIVVLVSGIGMSAGGALADRIARRRPSARAQVAAAYSVLGAAALAAGFLMGTDAGLILVFVGALLVAGHAGCSTAIVTELTHPRVRATVMATMILANNTLGFAPGPFVVGRLSDLLGLRTALLAGTVTCLIAAALFVQVARRYADRKLTL